MRSLLLIATLSAGVLAGVSAVPAQQGEAQQAVCGESLARLDQSIDALEGGGAPTPDLTRGELAELENLRRTARRLAGAGNGGGCERVVRHALFVVDGVHTPRVISADGLKDMALQGAGGEEVGTIRDVVLDPRTGRIAYAVVELGGFLGLGERYFPVPWAVFEPGARGDGLVLNVPRERLVTAPQFTRETRPDMADRQWALALHTWYGVEPYWLQGGAVLAGQVEQAGRNAEAMSRMEQEVMRLSQTIDRLAGRIDEALPAPPPQAEAPAGDAAPAPPAQ